jgi:hypothetical protein
MRIPRGDRMDEDIEEFEIFLDEDIDIDTLLEQHDQPRRRSGPKRVNWRDRERHQMARRQRKELSDWEEWGGLDWSNLDDDPADY